MNRRVFLGSPLVAGVAGLVAKFQPPVPTLWGDGVHDDTAALNAWGAMRPVNWTDGSPVGDKVEHLRILLSGTVTLGSERVKVVGTSFSYNYITSTPAFREEQRRDMRAMGLLA